jgi:hypothetical protein
MSQIPLRWFVGFWGVDLRFKFELLFGVLESEFAQRIVLLVSFYVWLAEFCGNLEF